MVLKLHGLSISTCTRRVATVLHEKGVPFELVPVDFVKHEHKSPAHLEKQPFGQVPFIDDDGFILYESRAIARYINDKYADQGPQLVPTDLKKRALFEQAASVELSNFDPFASGAVGEKLFARYRGLEPNEEAYDKHIKTLSAKLDAYEKILSKQKYLAGDEVTLADLFHLPYGALLPAAGSDVIQSRPNVARWFNDLTSRPSWQAVKDEVKSTA